MVGRYILRDILVETQRHRVFMARGLAGGGTVEIKLMQGEQRLHRLDAGESGNPYVRELRLATEAHCACIVPHRDAGTTGTGEHYLVRQWSEGLTVRDELAANTRFDLPDAVAIVADAATAVEALHKLGYVQRDLRPDVLITRRREASDLLYHTLLVDLEASVRLGTEGMTYPSGELVADPMYMAPELPAGAPVTPAADIYALGALLFECLSGRPALLGVGDTPDLKIAYLMGRGLLPTSRLSDLVKDLPSDLDLLISKCMRRDPTERPASVQQLLRGLSHVLKAYARTYGDDSVPNELWPRLVR